MLARIGWAEAVAVTVGVESDDRPVDGAAADAGTGWGCDPGAGPATQAAVANPTIPMTARITRETTRFIRSILDGCPVARERWKPCIALPLSSGRRSRRRGLDPVVATRPDPPDPERLEVRRGASVDLGGGHDPMGAGVGGSRDSIGDQRPLDPASAGLRKDGPGPQPSDPPTHEQGRSRDIAPVERRDELVVAAGPDEDRIEAPPGVGERTAHAEPRDEQLGPAKRGG